MHSSSVNQPLKIYIDENIAPQLARAFNTIQEHLNNEEKKKIEVYSIKDKFGQGIKDEEWIPKIGAERGIVITLDRKIQSSRHQRELYKSHGCGIIFLHSPKTGMSFWNMFKHLVKYWEDLKAIIRKHDPPFSFRQPGQNQNFINWDTDD